MRTRSGAGLTVGWTEVVSADLGDGWQWDPAGKGVLAAQGIPFFPLPWLVVTTAHCCETKASHLLGGPVTPSACGMGQIPVSREDFTLSTLQTEL